MNSLRRTTQRGEPWATRLSPRARDWRAGFAPPVMVYTGARTSNYQLLTLAFTISRPRRDSTGEVVRLLGRATSKT